MLLVDDIDQAIDHIRTHGTNHLRRDPHPFAEQRRALRARGGLFGGVRQRQHPLHRRRPVWPGRGSGGEHQKLHARGPMGLDALTTYKWIGYGDDLVRS